MQWEYTACQCNDVTKITDLLNQLGLDNWEVITVDFFSGKNDEGKSIYKARIIAKRPMELDITLAFNNAT